METKNSDDIRDALEVPTVKAAVCETVPVESRKVNPREVPVHHR